VTDGKSAVHGNVEAVSWSRRTSIGVQSHWVGRSYQDVTRWALIGPGRLDVGHDHLVIADALHGVRCGASPARGRGLGTSVTRSGRSTLARVRLERERGRVDPRSEPVTRGRGGATRVVVGTFGVLAALAGMEHGIGEIRQGSVPPTAPVIRSWPDVGAFGVLGGEPALTVLPDLLLSGILTVTVAAALGVWSVGYAHRRHGGRLALLSVLLLVVGGGFGPPLIGLILAVAVALARPHGRPAGTSPGAMSRLWPWFLVVGVLSYVGLVPGMLLASHLWGVAEEGLVLGLVAAAFGGMVLALLAARAADRVPDPDVLPVVPRR
jgi:hypothetical protein